MLCRTARGAIHLASRLGSPPFPEPTMRTFRWSLLLLTLALVHAAGPAAAFDGSRRGFVLGAGLGAGASNFKQTLSQGSLSASSDRESRAAFVSDFHIGGGIDETTVLSYTARVTWFSLEVIRSIGIDVVELDEVLIASGVGVFTLTKYAEAQAPSTFVRGGVGFSTWDTPLESDAGEASVGLGALLAVGYEFAPYWSVELGATWGLPSTESMGVELETNALSLHVAVVGMAY